METIGLIGLGLMGKPMARNIMRAGYPLLVHNRSRGAVDELVSEGARAAQTPAEVAAQCDIVMTMLPDPAAVELVIAGEFGIFQGAHPKLLVIDMSTSPPALAQTLAAQGASRGIKMLDAPVSGGPLGAKNASLTIMVGGADDAFDQALPLLQCLGSRVVHVGAEGLGQITKAANQMITGVTIAAVAEAFVLLERAGVDLTAARSALLGGFAASRVLEYHGARMIARDFVAGSRARTHVKDMEIALQLGHEYDVPLVVTETVAQMLREMVARGLGDADHSALIQLIEEKAG